MRTFVLGLSSRRRPVGQPAWHGSRRLPSQAEAYYEFLLGRHLESEGDVDEAIAAYERARALDPRRPSRRPNSPALYARQGRFD